MAHFSDDFTINGRGDIEWVGKPETTFTLYDLYVSLAIEESGPIRFSWDWRFWRIHWNNRTMLSLWSVYQLGPITYYRKR